ncbi:hypothetical protein, partial [Pseudomonas sp. NFACC24-1]|uniref:hypothetical protein n=1 Tax=Pseudomonas sp. NFACC24-1 TaxID=1566189 RepID=UPI001C4704FA
MEAFSVAKNQINLSPFAVPFFPLPPFFPNQDFVRFVGYHHNAVVRMQIYATEFHHGLLSKSLSSHLEFCAT